MATNRQIKLPTSGSGYNYVHPNHNSQTSGLYKITVDSLGHVSEVTSVIASDIIGLGIPAQDTTYATITQFEIINGTVTADRVITPKLLVDNFSKIGHTHSLSSADISGPLPVSKGGAATCRNTLKSCRQVNHPLT